MRHTCPAPRYAQAKKTCNITIRTRMTRVFRRAAHLKILDPTAHGNGNQITLPNAIRRKSPGELQTAIPQLFEGDGIALNMRDDCGLIRSNLRVVIKQFAKGHSEWYWSRRPIDNGWLGTNARLPYPCCHLRSCENVIRAVLLRCSFKLLENGCS